MIGVLREVGMEALRRSVFTFIPLQKEPFLEGGSPGQLLKNLIELARSV